MRSEHCARLRYQDGCQATTLEIADEYFLLCRTGIKLERKKFWFCSRCRSKKREVKIRALNKEVGAYWKQLLRQFRPLVSACFRDGGVKADSEGGYSSAMIQLTREFEKLTHRVDDAPCFADLLWRSLAELAPGGQNSISRYRVLFHLLALLDDFENEHQGTIRTGYFFQENPVMPVTRGASADAGSNADLRYEQLTFAFEEYHAFLCQMGDRVDLLTSNVIRSTQLNAANGVDVMFSWLV